MDFSVLKYSDCFSEISLGLNPSLYAAGSSAGSAVSMIGTRKLIFHINTGSGGAGSGQLLLYAASVSGGTGSTVLNGSNSLLTTALVGSLTSASGGTALVEVRGEFLENASVGPWVIPVLSVSGGSLNCFVSCQGFLKDYLPASNYHTAGYVANERDLL